MASYTNRDFVALQAEKTDDPLVRGYSGMTDQQLLDSFNAVDRDGLADPDALLQYLTLERFRTGSIYGRLKLVAGARPVRAGNQWQIAPLPLGTGDSDVVVTQEQIAAANAILRYVDTDTRIAVTLLDSRISAHLNDMGVANGCQVMGAQDQAAIEAFSQNQQSRVQELGLPDCVLSVVERLA